MFYHLPIMPSWGPLGTITGLNPRLGTPLSKIQQAPCPPRPHTLRLRLRVKRAQQLRTAVSPGSNLPEASVFPETIIKMARTQNSTNILKLRDSFTEWEQSLLLAKPPVTDTHPPFVPPTISTGHPSLTLELRQSPRLRRSWIILMRCDSDSRV